MTEHQLYEKIARYLQEEYPNLIYRFDLAADLKLTPGQAAKHKKLHPTRGYPDLFIAEPRGRFCGLFVELKTKENKPYKKDGELKAGPHLKEQENMLYKLGDRGYASIFASGFDEFKEVLEAYMEEQSFPD